MRDLVMLGVAIGARLGELLALRWRGVDLDGRTLRIGQSRRVLRGRRLATIAALKRLRATRGLRLCRKANRRGYFFVLYDMHNSAR